MLMGARFSNSKDLGAVDGGTHRQSIGLNVDEPAVTTGATPTGGKWRGTPGRKAWWHQPAIIVPSLTVLLAAVLTPIVSDLLEDDTIESSPQATPETLDETDPPSGDQAEPVSSDASLGERFKSTDCGSIIDSSTGLEWTVGPDINMIWPDAQRFAAELTLCNKSWRMPTPEELIGLYAPGNSAGRGYLLDGVRYPARIDPVFDGIGGGSWVWSDQELDASNAIAINLYLIDGADVRLPQITMRKAQTEFPARAFAVST